MDMALVPFPFPVTFPDNWYDTNVTAFWGTASWVVAGLATAYFVLKWLKNSEKFYAALAKQQKPPMGGRGR
jgi:hypothetical protein